MTQLEIYKEALNVMRDARVKGVGWWEFGYLFAGLCGLIRRIDDSIPCDSLPCDWPSKAEKQFVRDSGRVLGRDLPSDAYWFTEIEHNEPMARAERIEHLSKLIKLYEQKDNKEEPKA